MSTQTALILYDAACRAIAEAVAIDEVKSIRDQTIAMAACARVAKDRQMEADAVVLRLRATRHLGELIEAQRQTVGLSQGGRPTKTGLSENPVLPTLAMQGIDKNLAHDARVLVKLSGEGFEQKVADARAATNRPYKAVVNAAAIEQERAAYRARVKQGGTVDDLVALAASGFRAGVIYGDPPWPFETYSVQGRQRSPDRNYDTMTLKAIKALPIAPLAAENCALLLWGVWPKLPGVLEVITAWGFEYKTVGFVWVKTTKNAEVITLDGDGLHWGMGFATRSNTEPCLYARRGRPRRLSAGVHEAIIAPVGEHSAKPDKAHRLIERLYPGPYLELFARRPRDGWMTWGNEIPAAEPADKPYDGADDFAKSYEVALDAVREHVAAGGPSWIPREPQAPIPPDNLDIPPFLRRAAP
jgi:N6-adenosine-specific RNA methylase IME4